MQSHYCILSSHCHNWDGEVGVSLLYSTMTILCYFSFLKLLCRPILPKIKGKVMVLTLHMLLTKCYGSGSYDISKKTLIRVISPISRVTDKNYVTRDLWRLLSPISCSKHA